MITKSPQKGFTLLEVMISLALLASMSYFISTATRSALKNKTKIQKNLDENSSLDNALGVMIRDINLAFHYTDINVQLYNEAQDERIKACSTTTATNPAGGAGTNPAGTTPPTGTTPAAAATAAAQKCAAIKKDFKRKIDPDITEFNGEKTKLNFTATSQIRLRKDAQMSRQNEVGYELKTCKSRGRNKTSSNCLWRRTSRIIDKDITLGGFDSVLLERVESIKLRYLFKPKDSDEIEWRDTWKSKEGSDNITKDRFPSAVEITIVMDKSQNKNDDRPGLAKTVIAPIKFPNNIERTPPPAAPGSAPPSTQSPFGSNP